MPLRSTLRVRTSAVACSTFDVSFHHLDEHPQRRSLQAVLDELRSNRCLFTPLDYLRSTGEENPPHCVRITVQSGWSPHTPQRCSTLQGQVRHTTVQCCYRHARPPLSPYLYCEAHAISFAKTAVINKIGCTARPRCLASD